MTAAVLWKEYRQQRAVWLAIAILGVLLVVLLAAVMGNGTQWEVFQDRHIRGLLNAVVFCLVVTYGLVSGALLLAGELDEGTMVFLDSLTGQRGTLWARKCAAGALFTLFLSLVLAGMAVGLGFTSWRTALVLPLLGLNALAWGLLAGALFRTVLTAVLSGIALMAGGWLWSIFSITNLDLTLVEGVAAVGAGYASRRIFCREDRSRQPEQRRHKFKKMLTAVPADLQVLLWLIIRQGRWVLGVCVAGALLLGFTVNVEPLVLWPTATLLLGLALGLAVFVPDQRDRNRFLGSQRFSPGRLWAVKVLFWALAAFGITALTWLVGTALVFLLSLAWGTVSHDQDLANSVNPSYWVGKWIGLRHFSGPGDAILLAGIWPLYGFCFGQLFGQLARRPEIAVILAVFLAVPVVCLWLPSLLVGGVSICQVLILPVLMLATTRLTLRPWLAGRLWDARPMFAIASVAALMGVSIAGCLWDRAVEVPDVGEPFDVKAFLASLPSREQNEAGSLIQHAALGMQKYRQKVRQDTLRDGLDPDVAIDVKAKPLLTLKNALEIGHLLDQLFERDWVKEAHKAAALPLGMVEDPRRVSWIQGNADSGPDYEGLAELFSARALQLQVKGDSRASLDHLETALALARQVQNYATGRVLEAAHRMESSALITLGLWLEKLGPDRKLLLAALEMLQRHEAGTPTPTNSIKAAYVVRIHQRQPMFCSQGLAGKLESLNCQVPWEQERQTRIMRALALGALRLSQQHSFNGFLWRDRYPDSEPLSAAAARAGLPPAEVPGSRFSARQWGEFIDQSRINDFGCFNLPRWFAARSQQRVHGTQLVIALALYQADHGRPPATLPDIVPKYLGSLPNDPIADEPFNYRVLNNQEIIFEPWRRAWLTIAPGQAILWSGAEGLYFVVPFWPKQKEDQP
jgi:hypothetical protein